MKEDLSFKTCLFTMGGSRGYTFAMIVRNKFVMGFLASLKTFSASYT